MSDPWAPALGGVAAEHGLSLRIEELTDRGMIALRARLDDPAAAAALAQAGFAAAHPRKASAGDGRATVWMAPDEALLLLPRADVASGLAALQGALAGQRHLALDVTDARATFRLTGEGARETLAKGAPVDLTPGAFGPGDARRTHLGQVAAAFWMTAAEPDAFELVCFRSVAGYVFDWLLAGAAREARAGFC